MRGVSSQRPQSSFSTNLNRKLAASGVEVAKREPALPAIGRNLLPLLPLLPTLLLRPPPWWTRGRSSKPIPGRCRCCSAPNTEILREREASSGRPPRRSPSQRYCCYCCCCCCCRCCCLRFAAAAFDETEAGAGPWPVKNARRIDSLNTCRPYLSRSPRSCRPTTR
jgi:hypothetical protein